MPIFAAEIVHKYHVMPTTAIKISVDIPATGNYNIEELQQQLKVYAQKLIKRYSKKEEVSQSHRHSLSSLRGIGQTSISEEALLDDYLSEKYGI